MKKGAVRQLLVVLSTATVIAVNALANILPFNGLTTGQVSDRFGSLFVPAGYVFSIWGLIYLGLLAYTAFQALPSQRDNPRLAAMAVPYSLSCLVNAVWLLAWHYLQFELTVLLMLVLLALLIIVYLRLGIGRFSVQPAERLTTRLTFSVYLGWITVATIANISQTLWGLGWRGEPLQESSWTLVMLGAGALIALLMSLLRSDWAYILVLVWAYAGIAVKQAGIPLVANVAWVFAAVLGALAAFALLRSMRRSAQTG